MARLNCQRAEPHCQPENIFWIDKIKWAMSPSDGSKKIQHSSVQVHSRWLGCLKVGPPMINQSCTVWTPNLLPGTSKYDSIQYSPPIKYSNLKQLNSSLNKKIRASFFRAFLCRNAALRLHTSKPFRATRLWTQNLTRQFFVHFESPRHIFRVRVRICFRSGLSVSDGDPKSRESSFNVKID